MYLILSSNNSNSLKILECSGNSGSLLPILENILAWSRPSTRPTCARHHSLRLSFAFHLTQFNLSYVSSRLLEADGLSNSGPNILPLPLPPRVATSGSAQKTSTSTPETSQPSSTVVKTRARSATILPNFVGLRFAIHNGKLYQEVFITEEMVGRKLGEFVPTRKRFSYKQSKNK